MWQCIQVCLKVSFQSDFAFWVLCLGLWSTWTWVFCRVQKVWIDLHSSTCRHSVRQVIFVEDGYFFPILISLGVVGLVKLFTPSWFKFGNGICQENCPFYLDFPVLAGYRFLNYALIILSIFLESVMSRFSFLILSFWLLFLSILLSLAMGMLILLIFQRTNFWIQQLFVWFCFYFFISASIYFSSQMDFFPAIYSSWVCLLLFLLEISVMLLSC